MKNRSDTRMGVIFISLLTLILSLTLTKYNHVKAQHSENTTSTNIYEVQEGDTLWDIAIRFFSNGFKWTDILITNKQEVGYLPDGSNALIIPGQKLTIIDSTGVNVALNKPIIEERGQVVYKDYAQRLISKNITDGDLKTGWRTVTDQKNSNTMAVIDLLESIKIHTVAFKAGWDPKPQFDRQIAFKVDYSDLSSVSMKNEDHWIELETKFVNLEDRGQVQYITFDPINARYIRVQYAVEDNEWGGWGTLSEVMVY